MRYGVILRKGYSANEFCYDYLLSVKGIQVIFSGSYSAAVGNMQMLAAHGKADNYKVVSISVSMCRRLRKDPNAKYIEV